MSKLKTFSLLCHRDVELASQCLPSLVRYCRDPIELWGLDDGSLTPDDIEVLQARVPGLSILRRCQIKAEIEARLRDYPLCRKYREWCPWAAKLFDIPLWADEDYAYIDGDILFLREFAGLDNGRRCGAGIVSMHAYANVYSFGLRVRLARGFGFPLIARFNAGFLFVRRSAFDLDLIERFLHGAQGHDRPSLLEQTAWAVMAAHTESGCFNRRQIAFPQMVLDSQRRLKWRPVAIHFLGGTRHLIPEVAADAQDWTPEPEPIQLSIEKVVRLTPATQIIDVCSHRLLLRKCRRSGVIRSS